LPSIIQLIAIYRNRVTSKRYAVKAALKTAGKAVKGVSKIL
jgi:hypothetical protein